MIDENGKAWDNPNLPQAQYIDKVVTKVPGLYLHQNFISDQEEQSLLDSLEGGIHAAEWEESMSRRVQHYGFPFNYRTLLLDYATETKPFPPNFAELTSKFIKTYKDCHHSTSNLDAPEDMYELPLTQLTVNEYLPGQGIRPHIDTEACFGIYLLIIT